MDILFITHHWDNNSHHSKYSGYQRLVNFVSAENNVSVLTWGRENTEYNLNNIKVLIRKTPKRDIFYQKRLALSWYARKMENEYDIIHSLYCELGIFIKDKEKLITSVHVHPQIVHYKKFIADIWLKVRWYLIDKRVIKKAKANIAVSNNLLERLRMEGINNVEYIPHGIDTIFWNKNKAKDININQHGSNINVLVVGLHGINLTLLKTIIKKFPQIHFIIVTKQLEIKAENVSYQSDVSDERLRSLYKFADVTFKPLIFATANNSILESISMNTPVITNKIRGVEDYLSNDNSFLAMDENEFVEIFSNLLNDKKIISLKSHSLTSVSQKFSWQSIIPQLENIYSRVFQAYNIKYNGNT